MYKYLLIILPKALLSWITGHFTMLKRPRFIIKFVIKNYFIKKLKIDIKELVEQDINKYYSINEFFTRQLNFKYRKINKKKNIIVSPCDGRYLSDQVIKDYKLIQFKKKSYFPELQEKSTANTKMQNKLL